MVTRTPKRCLNSLSSGMTADMCTFCSGVAASFGPEGWCSKKFAITSSSNVVLALYFETTRQNWLTLNRSMSTTVASAISDAHRLALGCPR